MPGFTTHYLFGTDTYRLLPDSQFRRNLQKNHSAFALGLQGPDIFFYYLPGYLRGNVNLGQLAHRQDTRAFFSYLMESQSLFSGNSRAQAIADAYICGFLGHYTLDCTLHPYVYAFTKYNPDSPKKHSEYFGQHAYLETELDKLLLWQRKRKIPSRFHADRTILLNPLQKKVIAGMLAYAYRNTYPAAKSSRTAMQKAPGWIRMGTRFFRDPSGRKKVLMRAAEQKIFHRAYLSPMLPSDRYFFVKDPMNEIHRPWTHPWTKEISRESFFDLYQKAMKLYCKRLAEYEEMVQKGYTPSAQQKFARSYGNRSFLSGEPLW